MAAEKNFENKIKAELKNRNAWFLKYWGGAAYTKSGIPDILACYKGYFLGIEVKAQHGKPSELQLYNLKKIDESGGFAILLYPDSFDLFKQLLNCMEEPDPYAGNEIYGELKERWWSN